jgi:hypothetical protein
MHEGIRVNLLLAEWFHSTKDFVECGSQINWAGIVTWWRAGRLRNIVSIPIRVTAFFPGRKAKEAWSWKLFHLVPRLKMCSGTSSNPSTPYDMHTEDCTCLKDALWAQKIPHCESCRVIRSLVLRVADHAGWGTRTSRCRTDVTSYNFFIYEGYLVRNKGLIFYQISFSFQAAVQTGQQIFLYWFGAKNLKFQRHFLGSARRTG